MVKHFYIFRHGQSSHNLQKKILGHNNNSVLTDQGIEQSYNAAYTLKDKHLDIIISSPLRRAKQSSVILSKITKAPLQFDDNLAEANLGIIEGCLEEKCGTSFNHWKESEDKDFSLINGESKKQVKTRVINSLKKYANSNYKNLAISGHENALLQALNELNISKKELSHGEIVHIAYENGNWKYLGTLQ